MTAIKKAAADIVASAWAGNAPVWVRRLAQACDRESQTAIARRLKRSPSLVNMVLKNRYTGDLSDVQKRVEAALGDKVECPVLGTLSGEECLSNQGKPFRPSNHELVRLFVACKTCPNNISCKGKAP